MYLLTARLRSSYGIDFAPCLLALVLYLRILMFLTTDDRVSISELARGNNRSRWGLCHRMSLGTSASPQKLSPSTKTLTTATTCDAARQSLCTVWADPL